LGEVPVKPEMVRCWVTVPINVVLAVDKVSIRFMVDVALVGFATVPEHI
jgi:hypothetical protein